MYFFSLDAAKPLAVAVARRRFHLSYFHARMSLALEGDQVRYASHPPWPLQPAAAGIDVDTAPRARL